MKCDRCQCNWSIDRTRITILCVPELLPPRVTYPCPDAGACHMFEPLNGQMYLPTKSEEVQDQDDNTRTSLELV